MPPIGSSKGMTIIKESRRLLNTPEPTSDEEPTQTGKLCQTLRLRFVLLIS